jgi:hypothetical protein
MRPTTDAIDCRSGALTNSRYLPDVALPRFAGAHVILA